MIYLASPYSHPDPLVRQARFDAACHAAAGPIQAGHAVVAPIVHGQARGNETSPVFARHRQNSPISLSSAHVAPVAHVAGRDADRPVGPTLATDATSGHQGDDVGRSGRPTAVGASDWRTRRPKGTARPYCVVNNS